MVPEFLICPWISYLDIALFLFLDPPPPPPHRLVLFAGIFRLVTTHIARIGYRVPHSITRIFTTLKIELRPTIQEIDLVPRLFLSASLQ